MIDPAALDTAQAAFEFLRAVPGLALVASTNGGEYHGPCPVCGGTNRFVCWPRPRSGLPRAFCRQCHPDVMDPVAFLRWRDALSFVDACARLDVPGVRPLPRPPKALKGRAHRAPTLVDTTDFEDATGQVVLRKERYEPGYPDKDGAARDKSFRLYHPDPRGDGWALGKPAGDIRAMFALAACLAAPAGSTIYFTEGELKAKALTAAGRLATCRWEGGTAWRAAYRAPFVDQHAVILEDADATGAALTAKLLPDVLAVARSVRVIRFDELGEGADLVDWLAAGHTLDELDALVAATPPVRSPQGEPGLPPENAPPAAPWRLLTAAEVLALPPPSWLIDGYFETGKLAGLYGFYGAGKSFLALDWALCVATGRPWQGHAVQAGPVVYVCAEGSGGLGRRLRAWMQATGVESLPDTFRTLPDAVNLLDPASPDKLLQTLTAYALTPASLIIIDTLARAMPGGKEDNEYFSVVVQHAGEIQAATGAAVLVIHHAGKNELAGWRGGTAFPAGADTIIGFKNDDGVITLTCEKQKDHEYFPPSRWLLRQVDLGTVDAQGRPDTSCVVDPAPAGLAADGALTPRERQLLEALCEPVFEHGATLREMRDATDLANQPIFRAVNALHKRDYVMEIGAAKTPGHRWKATRAGYEAVGVVPPWQRAAARVSESDSDAPLDQAGSITEEPGVSGPELPGSDNPTGVDQARSISLYHGVSGSDTDQHSVTDRSLFQYHTPIGGTERDSVTVPGSDVIDADPLPDPSVVPPVWAAPPDDAPSQPTHVGFCGHSALAIAWDAATIRWRCRSCWALHRE